MNLKSNLRTEEIKFIDVLKTLLGTRDNRGKWHSLVFLIVFCHFSWIAINGKVIRGTFKSGGKQATVHPVSHESRIDVAQARQVRDKLSSI